MIAPNLSPAARAFYVISGMALIVVPFVADFAGSLRWVVVAMGLIALLEGGIGW